MRLHNSLIMSALLMTLTACGEDEPAKGDDTAGDADTDTVVDEDGDGFAAEDDCDDDNADINPDADEVCDGVDNDCDALVDADDDSVTDLTEFYADTDGDGYGDAEAPIMACEASAGVVADSSDCDDANSDINPDGIEICDAVDNDCDGTINGPDSTDATEWYPDVDEDGYGDASATPVMECDAPSGTVADATDCNDGDASSTTMGVDADCDGVLTADDCDDTDPGSYTVADDADCDGVLTADDCDDTDPALLDVAGDADCDGVLTADDCDDDDAELLEATGDGDGDGVVCSDDCDDTDAALLEATGDGDSDGFICSEDCDDTDDTIGSLDDDNDMDGFSCADDCDDNDASIHPYVLELSTDVDGIDNDCDGDIDAADLDAVEHSLSDDDTSTVTLMMTSFPFCGTDYTTLDIDSNGRLIFDGDSSDYSESASDLAANVVIAPFWDDFNPASSYSTGGVYSVEYADAVGVFWWGIVPFGGSAGEENYFSALLFDDGSMLFNHELVNQNDVVTGFSCGLGTIEGETDLSEAVSWDNSLGLGDGTEDMLYQQWTSSDPFDLDGWLPFCGIGGDDLDADGYTEECGDPDDADSAAVPTVTP